MSSDGVLGAIRRAVDLGCSIEFLPCPVLGAGGIRINANHGELRVARVVSSAILDYHKQPDDAIALEIDQAVELLKMAGTDAQPRTRGNF